MRARWRRRSRLPVPAPPPPSGPVEVVVVDYGGVLTNPLAETKREFARVAGVSPLLLLAAVRLATRRYGEPPMAPLETGRISEAEMTARVLRHLPRRTRERALRRLGDREFGEVWFAGRRPNAEFIAFLADLRGAGYRLALLTNNVREWEPRWRAQVPDGLFDVVVSSCEEGVRKPDPEIYRRLLARLGTPAERCLFVDDVAANVAVAAGLGLRTVRFTDTAATVRAVTAALATASAPEVPHVRA